VSDELDASGTTPDSDDDALMTTCEELEAFCASPDRSDDVGPGGISPNEDEDTGAPSEELAPEDALREKVE